MVKLRTTIQIYITLTLLLNKIGLIRTKISTGSWLKFQDFEETERSSDSSKGGV